MDLGPTDGEGFEKTWPVVLFVPSESQIATQTSVRSRRRVWNKFLLRCLHT